jgi:glycerol-3-phosphate dehydrogenase (NAD(P)+)
MKVAIIGDGGWGTALGMVLLRNGHEVTVWGAFEEVVRTTAMRRENVAFLPGVELPRELGFTADREEAVTGAEVAVLAVPTRYFRKVTEGFRPFVSPDLQLVSVAKGLDARTHQRMSEVAQGVLRSGPVAALSGPSHAEEVARGAPTAVVVACAEAGRAAALQRLFTNDVFRVYTSDDVIGVELGGALKNVIAVAAGIADGIGYGDNAKAALITRGLAEITRLGVALGAHPITFAGLSGMGDLIVTCTSRLSRNRSVGERIGRGEFLTQILDRMQQVAEGVWNCTTVRDIARELEVDVPITEQVHATLHEGKDPRTAVQELLGREPRPERD